MAHTNEQRAQTLPHRDEEWVLISSLNHYDYCPRRCWYIYREESFLENAYTEAGRQVHQRAHRPVGEGEEAGTLSSLYLYSYRLGLCGKSDIVELDEGGVYPVEYKSGRVGNWKNDELQLCAQALCLEEMLKESIERGYLYYHGSRRRKEILLGPEIRQHTERVIVAVRALTLGGKRPPANYGPRCEGCSLYPICLPWEMEVLRGERKPRRRRKRPR